MTSPNDQRRAFDAAIETYRSGNTVGALSAFVAITAANSGMSDAWLGRLACGDRGIAVLHGAQRIRGRFTARPGGSGWSTATCMRGSTHPCM